MIKLCTFFSDSHIKLYKKFMNSFPYEDGVDLIIRYIPQECEGHYKEWDSDWNTSMKKKVRYILDYLKDIKPNEFLIHADIDIVFYKKLKDDLMSIMSSTGNDIMFQNDGLVLCMGFFIAKQTPKTIALMENVLNNMDNYAHDQAALNALIPDSGVKYNKLPERYYSYGPLNGLKRWEDTLTKNINVPNDIVLHHANWTVGIDNKLQLIDLVKSKVSENN